MSWTTKLCKTNLKWFRNLLSARMASTDSNVNIADILDTEKAPIKKKRVTTDPETTTILLFPGQGSQHIGMANNLLQYSNVADMFSVASDILKFDLLGLCQNGPKSELDRTVHCQPALLVTSLAAVEGIQVNIGFICGTYKISFDFTVAIFRRQRTRITFTIIAKKLDIIRLRFVCSELSFWHCVNTKI